MLVLIDESGCPGFKLGRGSTDFFVVAMVIFNDFKEAECTSAIIKEIRESSRIKPEFKFSKCSDVVRDKFFTSVTQCEFSIYALVVDKARIYSPQLRTDTDSFYNFFVKTLIKYDRGTLCNASIKVDGSGDREFMHSLARYLRREIGEGKIKKFRLIDSKKDNLIQLADMCAGAIMRSYNTDRNNRNRWRQMLKKRIVNIWEFR